METQQKPQQMNDGDIKGVILHNLLKNESYSRKVVPFIKVEYFKDRRERILFESIQEFILKYNNLPTKEVLHIVLEKKETINESARGTNVPERGEVLYWYLLIMRVYMFLYTCRP